MFFFHITGLQSLLLYIPSRIIPQSGAKVKKNYNLFVARNLAGSGKAYSPFQVAYVIFFLKYRVDLVGLVLD